VQIALVKLAFQSGITPEASEIGVNRIFVPENVCLFVFTRYSNSGEIPFGLVGNFPYWDYDEPWQEGAGEAGAQYEFVSKAKHRPTRASLVNDITGNISTLEFPVCVDKE
jgi:hypothetical protein